MNDLLQKLLSILWSPNNETGQIVLCDSVTKVAISNIEFASLLTHTSVCIFSFLFICSVHRPALCWANQPIDVACAPQMDGNIYLKFGILNLISSLRTKMHSLSNVIHYTTQ